MTRSIIRAVDTEEKPRLVEHRSGSKFVDRERQLGISPFTPVDADEARIRTILGRLDRLAKLIPADATDTNIRRCAGRDSTFDDLQTEIATAVTHEIETLGPIVGLHFGTIDWKELMPFVHYRLKNHFSTGCFKRFGRYMLQYTDRKPQSFDQLQSQMLTFLATLTPRGRAITTISQFERRVRS